MKYIAYFGFVAWFFVFGCVLFLACGNVAPEVTNVPVTPVAYKPEPVKADTIHTTTTIRDTARVKVTIIDTARQTVVIHDSTIAKNATVLSVKDFGAFGDGQHDDYLAIQKACDYCILNPGTCTTVRFPIGDYHISKSILIQNKSATGFYSFCTINLEGEISNKSASNQYLSKITYTGVSGFAIGIQRGRSIKISNLTAYGQYTFPNSVNNYNIGTLKFTDWQQPGITDSRNNPYAGISIDPFENPDGSNGGSSDITIEDCSIRNWMVGIMLTANPSTQNDEIINILEDDIESCRDAIAIGQDQSKTVNIKGLKVWASVHTIIDGINYGRGTGGGSVFCENWNIAGNCTELFNLNAGRFPISCINIYSESLFRLGTVGPFPGANFINTQIDFLSGNGMPSPDYLLIGSANFYGGMLRYYDGDPFHRLNFSTTGFYRHGFMFRDMTLNNPPIVKGLYGIPTNGWPEPMFDNVAGYYSPMKQGFDTLIEINTSQPIVNNWVAQVYGSKLGGITKIGDYLIGEPTSTNGTFYDNPGYCPTKIIGQVSKISADTLTLINVGLNVSSDTQWGRIFISRIK